MRTVLLQKKLHNPTLIDALRIKKNTTTHHLMNRDMKENTITLDLQEYRDLKALKHKYNRLKRDYDTAIKDRRHSYFIHEELTDGRQSYKKIYSGDEAVIEISNNLEASIENNRYIRVIIAYSSSFANHGLNCIIDKNRY